MGKPHAQRQKEYLATLKERDVESYRKEDAERKQIAREKVKRTPALYENQKAKDRLRKQKLKADKISIAVDNSAYRNKQSLGKAVLKVVKSLPGSSGRREVLSRILTVSNTLRQKLHDTRGRPTISNEKKEQLVSFL